MKTTSMIVITASILLSSTTAFAFGDIVIAPPAPVTQPYDFGTVNQSPIRGKGQIRVVHNEPAPGDSEAELTKAAWLLKDNGWQVFKPNGRRQ